MLSYATNRRHPQFAAPSGAMMCSSCRRRSLPKAAVTTTIVASVW